LLLASYVAGALLWLSLGIVNVMPMLLFTTAINVAAAMLLVCAKSG
jgi:hypothetical protein